jgi:hypothetical protein
MVCAMMENGLVNLVAVVSMLLFCISAVPIILISGSPKDSPEKPNSNHH